MNLLLLQPGRLGDILICLPIAKYYSDKGYRVYWPVLEPYINTFDNIDYVNPIKLDGDVFDVMSKCYSLSDEYEKVIDLSLGFPDSKVNKHHNDLEFASNFVEAKYKLAGVSLDERWSLSYNRNSEKEDALFDLIVGEEGYTLIHDEASCGRLCSIEDTNVIRVAPIDGFNMFDWYKVAINANKIYCVDSSFCNFIESISDFKDKEKYYIPVKPMGEAGDWGKTTLKNNWNIMTA